LPRLSAPLSEIAHEWKSAHRGSEEIPAPASSKIGFISDCPVGENWHAPLAWSSGLCVYAYANPTVYTDPTGRLADGDNVGALRLAAALTTNDQDRALLQDTIVRQQRQNAIYGAGILGAYSSTANGVIALGQLSQDAITGGVVTDYIGQKLGLPSTGAIERASAIKQLVTHPIDTFYNSIDKPLQAASDASARGDELGQAFHEGEAVGNFVNTVAGARGGLGLLKSGASRLGSSLFNLEGFDPAAKITGWNYTGEDPAGYPSAAAQTPQVGAADPGLVTESPSGDVAPVPALPDASTSASVPPPKPTAYSVAYEMQLDPADFGRSRTVHFNRANAALDKTLQSDQELAQAMDNLIPGVEKSVARKGGRETPEGWTWEHASTSVTGGPQGVMRLVPSEQHTPGSPWWRILHPDPGAAGGYSEWAIPAGAPANNGGG
jgi:hypothetical protein